MRTSLVYMDSLKNSRKGFTRGFVIYMPAVLMTCCLVALLTPIPLKSLLFSLLFSLITVSALGVQKHGTLRESIVYGALVGACLYGAISLSSLHFGNLSLYKTASGFIYGVSSTALLAYILWKYIECNPYLKYD
jgi:hypothetical protein